MSAIFRHPTHFTARRINLAAGIVQTNKEFHIGIQG